MDNEIADQISIRIDKKFRVVSPVSCEYIIFKVRHHLRMVKEKAYEPEMLAIGPYHRGKENLRAMEDHKIRYLQMLLRRRGEENNVAKYVMAMRALEERARQCYADYESPDNDKGVFAEMMLLDGCFILELIRKKANGEWRDKNDPIFNVPWMIGILEFDMLLVENQLPFFVLLELFHMTAMPNEKDGKFIKEIFDCFGVDKNDVSIGQIKHLLGLVYDCMLPNLEREAREENMEKNNWKSIQCATELRESGINFQAIKNVSLFKMDFKNGIMEIPVLRITDDMESFFRNLIAYEQCSNCSRYVTDYAIFMDRLINSPKDVQLLRQVGIIDNWLGDDEVVATMFNRLADYVILCNDNFSYSKVFNDVNEHCGKRRHKWMANLRHNYFNTPWASISFTAAALLLLLTLTQTVFSVLACFK